MKQYYTPDGIVDIELSDRELYDEMLTGWVHNLQNMDEDAVYEAYERLFECEHIYFMRDEDHTMKFPADMFEYGASEFLKSVRYPSVFKGLIVVIRNIEIRSEDVLVNVVTLRPDNEDFQRALKIADRKKTITEFLLHNE